MATLPQLPQFAPIDTGIVDIGTAPPVAPMGPTTPVDTTTTTGTMGNPNQVQTATNASSISLPNPFAGISTFFGIGGLRIIFGVLGIVLIIGALYLFKPEVVNGAVAAGVKNAATGAAVAA